MAAASRASGSGAAGQRAQCPAGARAVAVDEVAAARVQRRDHERLPGLVRNSEVGDERLVEDRVDAPAVVAATFAAAPQSYSVGGGCSGGKAAGALDGHLL